MPFNDLPAALFGVRDADDVDTPRPQAGNAIFI